MKKIIHFLIFISPFLVSAQEGGVRWTEGLTWEQVIQKAKVEKKYIFLDCYTTWCRPCHAMDKNVYSDHDLGSLVNGVFVSVKLQMDSTHYDNDAVKRMYKDAKKIGSQYKVNIFPTFLFFSPDGIPIHRSSGYKTASQFVYLTTLALDSTKQYYSVLRSFKPGVFDTARLKELAIALKDADEDLAGRMAVDYLTRIPRTDIDSENDINLMCEFRNNVQMRKFVTSYFKGISVTKFSTDNNIKLLTNFSSIQEIQNRVHAYLSDLDNISYRNNTLLLSIFKAHPPFMRIAERYIAQLKKDKIFNLAALTLISDFTTSSKSRGFEIFYKNQKAIDSIFELKGFAFKKIVSILTKEYYSRYYDQSVENNDDIIPWSLIKKSISEKYGKEIADRIDIYTKSKLYQYFAKNNNTHWDNYTKYYIKKIEKYGTDTSGPMHKFLDAVDLNNFVFEAIFLHSTKAHEIAIGLKWMEGVIRRNPKEANHIDTYANLLYKAGKKVDAIRWQEKAVQTAIEENEEVFLPSLMENLAKMKKDEPTWINSSN